MSGNNGATSSSWPTAWGPTPRERLASKISTDTVPLVYHKLVDRPPPEALLAAVEEANTQIYNRGQASTDFKGMGTTTTALALLPYGALLAHVGDSRAYRLRGNRFEQLTFDHSLVWEMCAAASFQGQVPDYVPKNVITRSLGPSPKVQVDLEGPHPVVPGDTFLMCSDGLSGPVKDEEMGMILFSMTPAEVVRGLVDLANLRGGPDNITVIVVKAVGETWAQMSNGGSTRQDSARSTGPFAWFAKGVAALENLISHRDEAKKGPPANGKRHGRGPYSAAICSPSADFARQLGETLRELREAAAQAELEFDKESVNAFLDRAAAGLQNGDFVQAVRNYCQGISFLVAEFKRQGKSRPGGKRT